jgi:hypothetical protein
VLPDHRDDIRRIPGRGGQPGVLEEIGACLKTAADLFGTVRMGEYGQIVRICLIGNGTNFVHRHLILPRSRALVTPASKSVPPASAVSLPVWAAQRKQEENSRRENIADRIAACTASRAATNAKAA